VDESLPPKKRVARPGLLIARVLVGLLGAFMLLQAVFWFDAGVEDGSGPGSFALVGYVLAGLCALVAFPCLLFAFRPRPR